MEKYPRLTEMGILNPQQIVRYAVNSLNNVDYLLISYARPPGSFLPVSRTYEFPRVQKTVKAAKSGDKDYPVLESSPAFKEAIVELKTLVERRTTKEGIAQTMHNELRHLEEEFAFRTAALRSMIDEIKDK